MAKTSQKPVRLRSQAKSGLNVIRPSFPKASIVFDTYWRFASERQQVFFNRFKGEKAPWTEDPIIRQFKFTNAYRASDRVSQYLIRNVIYAEKSEPKDLFFRILLFKIFNKIETWQMLEEELEHINWDGYDYTRYDQILSRALRSSSSIYSAAYIMPSCANLFGVERKHQGHLKLLERMLGDDLHLRIADCTTMQEAFDLLRSYPSIGNFLGYQYVTDINYSELTCFSESEFVVPGPGALEGIRKCFLDLGDLSEADVIRLIADRQEEEYIRRELEFHDLLGRRLQLIDCQNLLCETDKYSRIAHPDIKGRGSRIRIKQRFRTTQRPIEYWYPPKWGINKQIGVLSRDRHSKEGGNGA